MASAQEVEMLRRQLDELTAQMIEIRHQSSSTAMNAAVTRLTEAVGTMGQSVSKPRAQRTSESESRSHTHLAKTLTTIVHSALKHVVYCFPLLHVHKNHGHYTLLPLSLSLRLHTAHTILSTSLL